MGPSSLRCRVGWHRWRYYYRDLSRRYCTRCQVPEDNRGGTAWQRHRGPLARVALSVLLLILFLAGALAAYDLGTRADDAQDREDCRRAMAYLDRPLSACDDGIG
jgi:hypothetical protein